MLRTQKNRMVSGGIRLDSELSNPAAGFCQQRGKHRPEKADVSKNLHEKLMRSIFHGSQKKELMMIKGSLLLVLILVASSVAADPVAISRIVSVYDGDTFRVDIDDWPPLIGRNMPIRVRGIDAPEIRTRCTPEKVAGFAARDFAAAILEQAEVVTISNLQRGKYFRIIADVEADGVSLADQMLAAGHAVNYSGGTRMRYCER